MAPYAKIELRDGQIFSTQFDDIYYSRDDGPAESEYVFLAGNQLPARWQGRSHYCIAETGFGSGLNFLVTLEAWLNDPHRSRTLDYFSIEAYPLSSAYLSEIYRHWPTYAPQSSTLIEQYPGLTRGCHSLCFGNGRVQLHLVFETLEFALNHYTFQPDTWYLDGFAPAKNPSMWQQSCLQSIADQSNAGTTLATFTAAGNVRRNLNQAGFEVDKRKGFGRKREMLTAHKISPARHDKCLRNAPWFQAPIIRQQPRKVAIVGAGIAGAQVAWHLAQRGVNVCVIEAKDNIASGASGNRAGVLAPNLSARESHEEAFSLAAFTYQLNQIKALRKQGYQINFEQQGLLQLAHTQSLKNRYSKLAQRTDLPPELLQMVTAEELSERLGEHVESDGLLIGQAGTLAPKSLCKTLLSHPAIELYLSTTLKEFSHHQAHTEVCLSTGETLSVDALVLANGFAASQFSDTLYITPVRGQTSSAQLIDGHTLRHALDYSGYVVATPGAPQTLIFGASYKRGESTTNLCSEETRQNLDMLGAELPELAQCLKDIKPEHAGIRATTRDRWPIVGPLADADFYRKHYADLGQGRHYKAYPGARYQQGLYVLSGLGSRGLTTAGYCANVLAHSLLGTAAPASRQILHALHPARFLIRDLQRGRGSG